MKKLIAIALLLFSSYAMADRVDIMEAWETAPYCMQKAEFYHAGAEGNKSGYPRVIKQMPGSFVELLEHYKPLPKEAMWAMQWNQLSPREQEFQSEIVYLGWDDVQSLKGRKVEITDDVLDKMTNIYFQTCVDLRDKIKAAPKTKVNHIIKTASSAQVAKPSAMVCEELVFDTNVIVGAKSENVPEESLISFAQSSKELSPERLERVIAQIKLAYGWSGDMDEWAARMTEGCN